MTRSTRAAAAILALLTVGLGSGCTMTVRGHGAPASNAQSPSKFATSTGPSTTSASSTVASTTVASTTVASTTVASTTVAPPTRPTTSSARATTAATRAQLGAQLSRLTPGRRNVLVTVTGAVEAVSYDQMGHLTFWRHTAAWVRVGRSSYPYNRSFAPAAVLVGTRLTGMAHATFIASGYFSGDSSANAAAYTTGARGWGAIKAEKNGNIGPSGQGVGFSAIGLANDFAFAGGLLMSADCSATGPIAACGGMHRVIKYWRWAGSDFVLDHRAGLPR